MTIPVDKWRYHFIHNVYADFFKDITEYIKYIYPRFQYSVIGTYDKAVEYLSKRSQFCRETDKPFLPSLALNPSGEFDLADGIAGGRQLWRFPNLAWGFNRYLFDPIYQDANLQVYVSFIRMKGEIELLMLLNSFYEYTDVKMLFINMFGGKDRIIEPSFFTSFIIIPEELANFEYTNEYTGLKYKIDWFGADAKIELVKTTARNELVVPCRIKPQISLVNLGDASSRYGGTDKLADWRLTATINYEVELPNFIILEGDYLAEGVNLEIRYGSAFSVNNSYDVPVNRQRIEYRWDWGLDETSNSRISPTYDATCQIVNEIEYCFNTRYFHIVTQAEANDSTANVTITLPEQITDEKKLFINGPDGLMDYGDHYIISDDGWTLILKTQDPCRVTLRAGETLELYVYEQC